MTLRLVLGACVLALAAFVSGCGDSGSSPQATTASGGGGAAGSGTFQIGLIISGSATDGGWNQLAWDDLQKIAGPLGAKVSKVEKVDPSTAQTQMREYDKNGVDLVIAHGFEFADPATEAAAAAKKSKFVVSGFPTAKPGVATLNFDLSQSCYQLGIIAARVSKSGKLGFIGGAKIPSLVACFNGFSAGAKSVRSDATVVDAYTSWDRPEQSKSQAEAFFQQGVDVILQNVDSASRGVFEAVKEHNAAAANKGAPAYVFGTNSDQNDNTICPDYTLASAVIKLDEAFSRMAKMVKDGTFKEGVVDENLSNDICVTVVNAKLVEKGVITPEVAAEVLAAGKKLAAGEIKIPG